MSRVVPLPAANTVVDSAVAIINADGTVGSLPALVSGNQRVALYSGGSAVGVAGNTVDTVSVNTVSLSNQALNYVFDGTAFARQRGDAAGGLVVQPGLAATQWSYAAASGGISNTTTAVTIKAAVASVRNCITSIQVSNGTLGAATEVAIRDGAAGTVLWRGFCGTAANQETFVFPAPLVGSVNTLLEVVTLTATVTGGVYVNVQGFTRA